MRIIELPHEEEEESIFTSSSSFFSSTTCSIISIDDCHGGGVGEWREDDTCIILVIPMPDGVRAKDVQVSMKHGKVSVCGNYCSSSSRGRV